MTTPSSPSIRPAQPAHARGRARLSGGVVALTAAGIVTVVHVFADSAVAEQEGEALPRFVPLDVAEWCAFAVLLVARVLTSTRARGSGLLPFLDLPLLGFALAVSGGSYALDPALVFGYVAALVLLEGARPERARTALALSFVAGLAVMAGVLDHHSRRQRSVAEARAEASLRARIDDLRRDHRPRIEELGEFLLSGIAGSPVLDTALANPHLFLAPEAYSLYGQRLSPARALLRALEEFLQRLATCRTLAALQEARRELESAESLAVANWLEAQQRWHVEEEEHSLHDELAALEKVWGSEQELLADLWPQLHGLELSVAELDSERLLLDEWRARERLRSLFGTLLLAAFAGFVMLLRDRLRHQVERVQQDRSAAEIALREREKEHWIAVTAGLTHGLGNDILAYDAFLDRALEALRGRDGVDPTTLERLEFVRESNRGRLGFLQFLESFARARKSAVEDELPLRPPSRRRPRSNFGEGPPSLGHRRNGRPPAKGNGPGRRSADRSLPRPAARDRT